MSNQNYLKDSIKMAWPAVVESFFVSLASMIDTMMVSNLGIYAVAAIGLSVQPKFIALALFLSTNIALSALVARRFGQNNRKGANDIFVTALVFTVNCALLISLVSYIFAPQFMIWCGSNSDTHLAGVAYFRIIQGGMIFNVLNLVINSALRGSGNTKIAMRTNITSSIVNVILNYLLIEGHFGFPRLGVEGAALATVLGTVVACLMSFKALIKKDSFVSLRYIHQNHIKPSFNTLKSITSLSLNFLIENLAMRVGFLATAIMTANLGTAAFGAHQVGMNFLSLSFAFGDGMQVASVALIGKALGKGDSHEAKIYGKYCQRIGLGISILIMVVMIFFGRDLFMLFFEEKEVLDMGTMIMNFIAIITLFQISQVIFGGSLRAAGDARYTLYVSLISVTIVRTLVTYLLTGGIFDLGLSGVWIGVLSDQLTRFILLSYRYNKGKWVNIKI